MQLCTCLLLDKYSLIALKCMQLPILIDGTSKQHKKDATESYFIEV